MIHQRYLEAFSSLTADELNHYRAALASKHLLKQDPTIENGQALFNYCNIAGIDHATLVMSLATNPNPTAVTAVERICMRPFDRRTPAEVNREREHTYAINNPPAKVATLARNEVIPDERTIKLNVTENPKRPGTTAHKRFGFYKDGQTIHDFIKAGGTRGDISWDSDPKRAFITIIEL